MMSFVNSLGKLLLAVPANAQYFPIRKALIPTLEQNQVKCQHLYLLTPNLPLSI